MCIGIAGCLEIYYVPKKERPLSLYCCGVGPSPLFLGLYGWFFLFVRRMAEIPVPRRCRNTVTKTVDFISLSVAISIMSPAFSSDMTSSRCQKLRPSEPDVTWPLLVRRQGSSSVSHFFHACGLGMAMNTSSFLTVRQAGIIG